MTQINKNKFKEGLDMIIEYSKYICALSDSPEFYSCMSDSEYFMLRGFLDALIKLNYISEEFKEDIEDICAFSKSQQEFETALFAITTSQKFEEVTK